MFDKVKSFNLVNDKESLIEYLTNKVHSFYTYKNNLRKESHFIEAQAIVLDFDNKGKHDDSTIDEFVSSEFAKKHNWILYSSKSYIPNKQDCFHVALFLDKPITSADILKKCYKFVLNELKKENIKSDPQVCDAARLIYPSRKSGEDNIVNLKLLSNTDGEFFSVEENYEEISNWNLNPKKEKKVREDKINSNVRPDFVPDKDNIYAVEYYKMSEKQKHKYMRVLMKSLNFMNFKTKYDLISRKDWINLGYALDTEFGKEKGYKYFLKLSRGHPNDSISDLRYQYDVIRSSNDYRLNIEAIINISRKLGFNHNIYFNRYFKYKQIFSNKRKKEIFNAVMNRVASDRGVDKKNLKIHSISSSKFARTFVIENISDGSLEKISISYLIDIVAELFKINKKFVTTIISRGILRQNLNKNSFDYEKYIVNKIAENSRGEYFVLSDINKIVDDIKKISTREISLNYSIKNIVSMLIKKGIVRCKVRKRIDGIQSTVLLLTNKIVDFCGDVVQTTVKRFKRNDAMFEQFRSLVASARKSKSLPKIGFT